MGQSPYANRWEGWKERDHEVTPFLGRKGKVSENEFENKTYQVPGEPSIGCEGGWEKELSYETRSSAKRKEEGDGDSGTMARPQV